MVETLRQAFHQNGEPIAGLGIEPESARNDGNLVGVVRVWLWRDYSGRREVLVQKRAKTKRVFPGAYDLAVGGHIDLGEVQAEAAAREAYEELGIKLDPEKLRIIGMTRLDKVIDDATRICNLVWNYSYQLVGNEQITIDPKEVESTDWLTLDACLKLAEDGKVPAPAKAVRSSLDAITAIKSVYAADH